MDGNGITAGTTPPLSAGDRGEGPAVVAAGRRSVADEQDEVGLAGVVGRAHVRGVRGVACRRVEHLRPAVLRIEGVVAVEHGQAAQIAPRFLHRHRIHRGAALVVPYVEARDDGQQVGLARGVHRPHREADVGAVAAAGLERGRGDRGVGLGGGVVEQHDAHVDLGAARRRGDPVDAGVEGGLDAAEPGRGLVSAIERGRRRRKRTAPVGGVVDDNEQVRRRADVLSGEQVDVLRLRRVAGSQEGQHPEHSQQGTRFHGCSRLRMGWVRRSAVAQGQAASVSV